MEQAAINAVFGLITGLAGLVLAIVGYWAKRADARADTLEKELTKFQLDVTRTYVPRDQLEKTFERLFDGIENIQAEITHISRNQASVKKLEELMANHKGN